MFGNEFCCAAINSALSVKPAVKEAPIATYLEKSNPFVFNSTSGTTTAGISSKSLFTSHDAMAKDARNNPIYL